MSTGRILWGAGTSRTIRAHWALHELGLSFELRPILPRTGQTKTTEFTALNARQKIPLLQDNGLILTESAAIISYLSDAYAKPDNRLIPIDPQPRARCLEWCFFVISELDATSLYVMRRHGDLGHIYGDAPVANASAANYFQQQMRSVERALHDDPRYILGDSFSAADILLSTCLTWAVRYGVPVSDPVMAYNQRVTSRPAYARALNTNHPPADAGAPAR
ncbi:glutathione S-transferase family protein [Rhodopila sp.]|uniref:glutathione S-transferase family protein n=1 Tax=Rhodopila sp. TaxID=2480087 RepID=UPI003D146900